MVVCNKPIVPSVYSFTVTLFTIALIQVMITFWLPKMVPMGIVSQARLPSESLVCKTTMGSPNWFGEQPKVVLQTVAMNGPASLSILTAEKVELVNASNVYKI